MAYFFGIIFEAEQQAKCHTDPRCLAFLIEYQHRDILQPLLSVIPAIFCRNI